ncbi:MAG: hypothetical protein WD231_05790 [Candidatus Woykebacteria bacterium]
MNFLKILRPINAPATFVSLIIIIASSYLVWSHLEKLPPQVPLWYSKVWGVERLAEPRWLFIIPSLLILIFLINQFIAKLLKSPVLTQIITWATLFSGAVISYSLLRILLIAT